MPGLDPGIYDELPKEQSYVSLRTPRLIMDCRVKPGNDGGEGGSRGGNPSASRVRDCRFTIVLPQPYCAKVHEQTFAVAATLDVDVPRTAAIRKHFAYLPVDQDSICFGPIKCCRALLHNTTTCWSRSP